jgi:hypothetical protein
MQTWHSRDVWPGRASWAASDPGRPKLLGMKQQYYCFHYSTAWRPTLYSPDSRECMIPVTMSKPLPAYATAHIVSPNFCAEVREYADWLGIDQQRDQVRQEEKQLAWHGLNRCLALCSGIGIGPPCLACRSSSGLRRKAWCADCRKSGSPGMHPSPWQVIDLIG